LPFFFLLFRLFGFPCCADDGFDGLPDRLAGPEDVTADTVGVTVSFLTLALESRSCRSCDRRAAKISPSFFFEFEPPN
jgi:hypothetical protein